MFSAVYYHEGVFGMLISSTEMQNNFGKYLMLATETDITITRNGVPVAKLTALGLDYDMPPKGRFTVAKESASQLGYYATKGKKFTYAEFLELTKDTEARFEYIDGEIYLQASPKTPHQTTVGELFVQFHAWSEPKGCRPFVAPYDIILKRSSEQINLVQPDLMIICDLDEHLDEDGYYKGVPTLLVEVLSEGTARMDLVKKFDLYMSCGIKEYWVVDPEERVVFVYSFQNRKLIQQSTYKDTGKAKSMVFPDLIVDLARIFR